MIQSVTVKNYHGETKKFVLTRPEESGCIIKSITGLGPAKATVNMSENAISDGSIFNSSRVGTRNIVISLKLLDKPTIEDVRQEIYRYFPIKQLLTFTVKTDNRECYTTGYVESNEPDIFSSSETMQISIVCPDPYFYSVADSTINFAGISSGFEFPFENDSLTEPKIELGTITSTEEKTIYYSGDAEVGITLTIHATGTASSVTVYKTRTRELIRIDNDKLASLTGSGIIAGDDIIISTVVGQKSVKLLRNGDYTNILNCIDKNPSWFKLERGDNIFAFYAETGMEYLSLSITSKIAYEGI